jgi:hypothetical protein
MHTEEEWRDYQEYWLKSIDRNAEALENAPEELFSDEFCLAAVKITGEALHYLPETAKTEAVCLAAVQQEGTALYSVPEALKSETLCLAAVKADGQALEHVPVKYRTFELCLEAMSHPYFRDRVLKFIPDELRAEVCLEAMGDSYSNDKTLKFTPYEPKKEKSAAKHPLSGTPSGDETTFIALTGKGRGETFETTFNIVRRCIENHLSGFTSQVGCTKMSISDDKTSFVLDYFCDGDHPEAIDIKNLSSLLNACLYKSSGETVSNLPQLFIVTGIDRVHEQARNFLICEESGNLHFYDDDRLGDFKWRFSVGDGEDKMYATRSCFEDMIEKTIQIALAS